MDDRLTRRAGPNPAILRLISIGALLIVLVALIRFNLLQPVSQTAYDVLGPVQSTLNHVEVPGADLVTSAQDTATMRATIAEQQTLIDQLSAQIVRARELEIENQRLRDELNYRRNNPGFEVQRAEVIGEDPTNLIRSITIDKGERNGLKPGMVVVDSAGALVGRLTQVTAAHAKVLLLTDASSSVYAMLQSPTSRAPGLLDGVYGPYLKMRLIAQTEDVQRGDVVLTSGRGPKFPKGIYIGRVLEVHKNNTDAFQEAIVEPAARLEKLESVQIIMNFLPQPPDS